jgi:hypothetical protein
MPYTGGYPNGAMKWARGRYDFAVDGGAIGDIDLTSTTVLPANAVIMTGFIEVDVVPTSGGSATIALKAEGAADLLAASAISGAPWSTTGRKSVVPVGTGAASVKTSAARKMQATVATAALTAGSFDVVVGYVEMPD